MLTQVADDDEVSASEWLREAIRESYQKRGLERLPQQIRRAASAFATAHSDYLQRWKRVSENGGNMAPPAKFIGKSVEKLREFVETKTKGKRDLVDSVKDYSSKLHGAHHHDPAKGQKALQESFEWVLSSLDAWLDAALADEA